MNSSEILDREFLGVRARILELAASLDRIQRADGDVDSDPRMALIKEGFSILQLGNDEAGSDRAEKFQLLFSREYDADWQKKFAAK